MMQISAYGRIGSDPKQIDTSTGKAMTVCSMAVSLSSRDQGEATEWVGVVAFGKQADALAAHRKGDLVSISGNVQLNRWKDKEGNEREQLQVVADIVLSARTVRPQQKSAQHRKPSPKHDAPAGDLPFDDPLPF